MTARQYYFTLIIFSITLKIQKLPCFMYSFFDKDTVFLALLFLVLNILGIIATYIFAKYIQKNDIMNFKRLNIFKFLINIALIIFAVYFLFQSLLFYEAIQDLFSHILFDNLSWTLFSFFLLFAIFYLAGSGLKIIGRTYELFFMAIIVSMLILTGLGALHTDFSAILPLETLKNANFFEGLKSFNLWFGDYILVFILAINTKNTKLKNTVFSYIGSILFVCLLYVEFFGIFQKYTPIQSSLISLLSDQSLLGIDIGRLDWFCILIAEIGAVLSCALCVNLANRSINIAMPKLKPYWSLLFLIISIYIADIFFLVDMNAKKLFFIGFTGTYAIVAKILIFALLILVCWHYHSKTQKKKVSV